MLVYLNELEEIKITDKIFNIIKHEHLFENVKMKKNKKVATKLIKILKEENARKVVLSNNLFENEILLSTLKENRMDIIDGKLIYKILLPKIIEKICYYKNSKIEEEKITILTDEYNEINKSNILVFSQNAKMLNIVTNFTNKFVTTANYLYEEFGILVKVSNNIRKDLLNSNIIINIDFNNDLINKYYINTKAIIVNIPEEIKIKSKKFTGININSYNIIIPDYELNGFDNKHIYEAKIYNKSIAEMQKSIEEDEIKIKNFIGEKGIINKKEFLDF